LIGSVCGFGRASLETIQEEKGEDAMAIAEECDVDMSGSDLIKVIIRHHSRLIEKACKDVSLKDDETTLESSGCCDAITTLVKVSLAPRSADPYDKGYRKVLTQFEELGEKAR